MGRSIRCKNKSCGSAYVISDPRSGESYCKKCGAVLDSGFASDTEAVPNLAECGSVVSGIGGDGGAVSVSDKTFGRLRQLNNRARGSRRGGVKPEVIMKIRNLSEKLSVPSYVRERATIIYSKSAASGLIRGRTIDGMVLASVYLACREMGVPRTLDDMINNTDVKKRYAARSIRAILKGYRVPPKQYGVDMLVGRLATDLNVPGGARMLAILLAKKHAGIAAACGKSPISVASAIIYIAMRKCGNKISQREIAVKAGISDVTVRGMLIVFEEHGITIPEIPKNDSRRRGSRQKAEKS